MYTRAFERLQALEGARGALQRQLDGLLVRLNALLETHYSRDSKAFHVYFTQLARFAETNASNQASLARGLSSAVEEFSLLRPQVVRIESELIDTAWSRRAAITELSLPLGDGDGEAAAPPRRDPESADDAGGDARGDDDVDASRNDDADACGGDDEGDDAVGAGGEPGERVRGDEVERETDFDDELLDAQSIALGVMASLPSGRLDDDDDDDADAVDGD